MPSRVVSEEPLRSVSQLVTHTAALSESTQSVRRWRPGHPNESMQAGFDMDLYLDWRRDGHPNGYNLLLRNTDTPMEHEGDSSYFNADSGASIASFLTEYLPDELSSDADVLLSLSEPAVSGGQLTLSPQSFVCLVKPFDLTSAGEAVAKSTGDSQRAITTNTNTSSLVQLTECIAIVVNMSYGRGRTARTLVCQVAGTSTQSGPRTAMQTTSSTRFASKESS